MINIHEQKLVYALKGSSFKFVNACGEGGSDEHAFLNPLTVFKHPNAFMKSYSFFLYVYTSYPSSYVLWCGEV